MSSTDYTCETREIDRSRTAISRNNFSTPVQHLLQTGLLSHGRSFFDYGCGKGDDLVGLVELGYNATGWDPAYRPDAAKSEADLVNLGFVLNVIEDAEERRDALRSAWKLTRGTLIVTVISARERPNGTVTVFNDGYVTSKRTFQRYYDPGELKSETDKTLGMESIPVGPFQVLCFRDSDFEMEYLTSTAFNPAYAYPVPTHPLRKSRINSCIEAWRESDPERWDAICSEVTRYAIAPAESAIAVVEELTACGIKSTDILRAVSDEYGRDEWDGIVSRVRNRYIAQIALSFFRGTPRPSHFGEMDRKAIRLHFGSFSAAVEGAKRALFSIGDPTRVTDACTRAGVGVEDEQALYAHQSCVPHLDAVLQTYVGAGRLFYGNLGEVDVFKIHKRSGKLTLLIYDDFEGSEEPVLQTRVKIDYRSRQIWYFDHSAEEQRLTDKPRYMMADSYRA